MTETDAFETERPRLVRLAARVLGDHAEAEDVVQQAWLRLHRHGGPIDHLPGWLTTVTTRLCLDRLRARVPFPDDDVDSGEHAPDPADQVALADTVGVALHVVLDRLSPGERVAFVLHDTFGIDFATIAATLDTSPAAARKLASRARAKVAQPAPDQEGAPDAEVVDAFLAAARGGDLDRLLQLLAPDATIGGDPAAVALGTPERIAGQRQVAEFFNGAAKAALPVSVGARAAAAWLHRGEAKVVFDFTVAEGRVHRIDFRADPEVLANVRPRRGAATPDPAN